MDKLSEYETELIEQDILRKTIPMLVREMLFRGLIDITRKDDADYLWDRVYKHNNLTKEIRTYIAIHDKFIQQARASIKKKDYFVAIILLATAIEHILNIYYSECLYLQNFSSSEIKEIIRKNNSDAKIGWLLSLTGKTSLSPKQKKAVSKIFEIRNSIVHYKPGFEKIDELRIYDVLESEIEGFDFQNMLVLIGELEITLQDSLGTIDPNRNLSFEIAETLFEGRSISKRDLRKAWAKWEKVQDK